MLKYFGLTEGDAPTVRIINTDTVKKYALGGAITTQSLTEFCQGVLDGTIKVTWQHVDVLSLMVAFRLCCDCVVIVLRLCCDCVEVV